MHEYGQNGDIGVKRNKSQLMTLQFIQRNHDRPKNDGLKTQNYKGRIHSIMIAYSQDIYSF